MNSSKNQGEGNKEADQNYRKDTRDFVEAGKVDKAAKDAANMTEKELRESEKAAAEAKKKAKY